MTLTKHEVTLTKHEQAYQSIRARIVDGTYGPGYRLVIDQLARELGVSSVPIREAIRRLEAEKWVVFHRNVGAQVAKLDIERWVEGMTVLALLEGSATALAAPFLRGGDLERARAANEKMRSALDEMDVNAVTRLNRDFHFTLYASCPNRTLVELIAQTWDRLEGMRRSLSFYLGRRAVDSLEEHARLIELVEEGADEREIEEAARNHKVRTAEAYLEDQRRRELAVATPPAS